MPSATTADSSDSIAPSSAKAIASGSTACAFASENAGSAGSGNSRGMPPKRVPMVSTGSDSAQVASAATATAIRMPGQVGRQRSQADDDGDADGGNGDRREIGGGQAARQRDEFRDQFARLLGGQRDAEEILELACEDDDGDARR